MVTRKCVFHSLCNNCVHCSLRVADLPLLYFPSAFLLHQIQEIPFKGKTRIT